MRIHTSQNLTTFASYFKLGLSLVILYVIASQGFKYWQQDSGLQKLQQLTGPEAVQPQE